MEPCDRGCLDGAYNAILAMVKADNYARYKGFIIAQRQLRVARLEAIWWRQVCSGGNSFALSLHPNPQLFPAISYMLPLVS